MTPDYSSAARASRPAAIKTLLIAGLVAVSTAAAFTLRSHAVGTSTDSATSVTATAAPPSALVAGQIPSAPKVDKAIVNSRVKTVLNTPSGDHWQSITVARGQTLSTIFKAHGLNPDDWRSVLVLGGDTSRLRHLQIGNKLRFQIINGQLQALTYAYDSTHTLDVHRAGQELQANTVTAALDHRPAEASGQIHDSLFVDGQHAGLSNNLMLEFAHIFNYDVDFGQDLQAGDRFTVIYDRVYKNGKKLRDGNILAAELVNQGHTYRAVRFVDKDGNAAYYTPNGQPLRRAFIRTPVAFTRISSGFSLARLNPVLHTIRPHYGTDYAAPAGTPVHATASGRVAFISRDGGYGNVIKVRHGAHYETIYAHLSRFRKGLGTGSKVQQDEVIGYVGMTGLATGPHLHYEFRINGEPKNPVTVKLPRGQPLPPHEIVEFRKEETPLVARINSIDSRQYADNGPTIGTR